MEPNTGTESRNVDVMNVRNGTEQNISHTCTDDMLKDGNAFKRKGYGYG